VAKYTDKVPNGPRREIDTLARNYPAGFDIGRHAHDAHQIVHAESGIMRVGAERGQWVVPPGRAVWMPARMVHWIHCVTPVMMRTIYIGDGRGAGGGECEVWSVSPLMREIIIRLVEGADGALERVLIAALRLEISQVDATRLHLPQARDRRLRRVTEALQAAPGDRRSLDEWAQAAGAAPRTLIRLFVKDTGMTFREWRRQLRILCALEALACGQSVTAVALELGYASPSAFIHAFREVLGVTPARYYARTHRGPGPDLHNPH